MSEQGGVGDERDGERKIEREGDHPLKLDKNKIKGRSSTQIEYEDNTFLCDL